MDSTEPSPNNISASNLHRLAALLSDADYAKVAVATAQAFEAEVEQFPWCFVGLLDAVVWERCGGVGVVVVGEGGPADADGEGVVQRLRKQVGVGRTVVKLGDGLGTWLRGRNQLLKTLDLNRDSVWICQGGSCREGLDVFQGRAGGAG